jgi:2-polyprenyl-3-methyl-5-hydroxy-6-metoxy-1,4-benzoquinol methylase
MGKEQPANYYDTLFAKSEAYKTHWSLSRYFNLWESVIKEINLEKPIIDIGCGPGQFGLMCAEKGCKSYLGLDFSSQAIGIAQDKCKNYDNVNFIEKDLFSLEISNNETQFLALEVLEHINEDLAFLEKLKKNNKGALLVITVPTFDDAGHARYFKTAKEWQSRFEKVIKIEKVKTIGPWILITSKL